MKRLSVIAIALSFGLPAMAQEEGFCMSVCEYRPVGPELQFSCSVQQLGEFITGQRYPSSLFENLGELAVSFSTRNMEMGINVAEPAMSRIFYPCGMPLT